MYIYRLSPKDNTSKTGSAVLKIKKWGSANEVREKEDLSLNIPFCILKNVYYVHVIFFLNVKVIWIHSTSQQTL